MRSDVEYELALLKSRRRKNIVIAIMIIIIIAGALAVSVFFKGYKSAVEKYEDMVKELEGEVERLSDAIAVYEEASREVDIRVINAEIQDISELATVEYLYTDAGKFEDSAKLFGKDIPFSFTTKSFIAKWDGTIKAGVDISKVRAEADEAAKEIIVYIPKAEILSHEIDNESIETLDEKNGLFNQLKVDDIRDFDAISKEAMEQRAIENGLLDRAFANAEEIIYKVIDSDMEDGMEYTIIFKEIEEQ